MKDKPTDEQMRKVVLDYLWKKSPEYAFWKMYLILCSISGVLLGIGALILYVAFH